MTILSDVQQAAAQRLDSFVALRSLLTGVTGLENNLANLEIVTPELLEARSENIRDAIRSTAEPAEKMELAFWVDDPRAWALADSIRLRTALLWDEWREAEGEQYMC